MGLVARDIPIGVELIARDPLREKQARVRICTTAHVDPMGERMKA
jgi:hypothetical protein